MTLGPIGFPAQARQATFNRLLTELRAEAEIRREEAVTGRMADIAKGRGGSVAEVLELDKRLTDLRESRAAIGLAQGRAAAIQAALSEMTAIGIDIAQTAQVAIQGVAGKAIETVGIEAERALVAVTGLLNTSFAGRSLFAGNQNGATAVVPAADPATIPATDDILARTAEILAAAPDAAAARAALDAAFVTDDPPFYYRGGAADAPAVELAPGERVGYHARADEAGIGALLRDLAVLTVATEPGATAAMTAEERDRLIADAADGLLDSQADLNAIRARIGTAEERMETIRTRGVAEETRLTESLNALVGRDTLEAATRMQAIDGQLETLFLTTARFSQLSLANFLR